MKPQITSLNFKNLDPKGFLKDDVLDGTINIVPKVNMELAFLEARVVMISRGKKEVEKHTIESIPLKNFVRLEAGKSYSYDFTYHNEGFESYSGVNLELVFVIEIVFKFSEKASENKNWMASFMQLFKLDKPYIEEHLLPIKLNKVSIGDQRLHLKEGYSTIGFLVYLFVIIFSLPSYIIGLHYVQDNFPESIQFYRVAIGPILLFSLFIGGIYFYQRHQIRRRLEKLEMSVSQLGGDELMLSMNIDQSKNIQHLIISYNIEEITIDNRGSTAQAYNKSIFISEPAKYDFPKNNIQSRFKISSQFPGSIKIGDSSIQWIAKAEIKHSKWQHFLFKSEFIAKKMNVSPNNIS